MQQVDKVFSLPKMMMLPHFDSTVQLWLVYFNGFEARFEGKSVSGRVKLQNLRTTPELIRA